MYRYFWKRFFDVVVAVVALAVLSPILLLLMVSVRALIGSPVFFIQKRPGLDGKPFDIYKFRTMSMERNSSGGLSSDERRMTRLGRLLRKMSLDELPELLNVLKNDMSLVGPRPLLMEYLPLYTPRQARRHLAKPGITGWAQVSGRNAISWEEKFELDIWYVENCSFGLDLKILFMTIFKVLKNEGITSRGCATTMKFRGSGRLEETIREK